MFTWSRAAALVLAFALPVPGAAQVPPPTMLPPLTDLRVAPSVVEAGDPVFAVLNGTCFSVVGDETVTVEGNVVTLTHELQEICGTPPPPIDFSYPIGSFAPGTYTLVYAPTSSFVGLIYLPQSVDFEVLGATTPAAIPADATWAAALLVVLLLGLGAWRLTRV